jgi:ABC-2 type transport system permease protein
MLRSLVSTYRVAASARITRPLRHHDFHDHARYGRGCSSVPHPEQALVLGKALSAGVRGLAQGVIVYLLTFLLGIRLDFKPQHILAVGAFIVLDSGLFSTFSLAVACLVKTRERFMGIGQALTMPLCFASNAIYPIASMATRVRAVARVNPLSYEVDALRSLMVEGGRTIFGIGIDVAVLVFVFGLLVHVAARLYPDSKMRCWRARRGIRYRRANNNRFS